MDVLLVSVNTERITMTVLPVGLAAVATAARAAGHATVRVDVGPGEDAEAVVGAAVDACRPDVIGISVRNVDNQDRAQPRSLLPPVARAVHACRARSAAPVVLGGAGFSIFPRALLARLGADYGVCGEGERAFPALLACLAAGRDPAGVSGVVVRGRGDAARPAFARDLDALPLPGPEEWPARDAEPDLMVPLQARRGCPMGCSYCSTASIEGRAFRFRSAARVADQVAAFARAGLRRLFFVDNVFNLPEWYARRLCREIAARHVDVAWNAILYPRGIGPEFARLLAEAGCVEVSVGFESGAAPVLAAMGKRFDTDDVRRACDALGAAGIRRNGFLLLGGPGETPGTAAESLAFAGSLGLDSLKVTRGIRIYPRTRLAEVAVREGVITAEDDLVEPTFYCTRM